MTRLLMLAIYLTTMLFIGCEPAASFDQPQPADVKSLQSFPERLRGNYLATDQASIVTITGTSITRHYDFYFTGYKDSLGASYKLVGDTLINLSDSTKEYVQVKGDTIVQHYEGTDTLFNISAGNILKQFKGYYFLNMRYSNNAWEVKQVALEKGRLSIASISNEDDVQKLKAITATTADTVSTRFSLTKRQFKKFVRQDGFADKETFIRASEMAW